MKKLKTIIFLLFIACIINACWEKVDFENLKVSNKSNTAIYCSISNSDEFFDYSKYLLLQRIKSGENISEIDVTDLYLSDIILADATIKVPRPMIWSDYINKSKDGKIRVFLIEKDSVDKYGWKYVNENALYNKKYLLTFDDLEKIDWNIIYE